MGGKLFFNRLAYSTSSSFIFGGQISQFNIYSDVLSSESIQKIAEGGLCFDLEEFSEIRILRWKEILDRSRNGDVRAITMCEWRKQLEDRLRKPLENKLAEITGQYNETKTQLSRMESTLETVTGRLNSTEEKLETVTGQLNSTEDKLETVTGHLNSTEEKLDKVTGHLNSTEEKLEVVTGRLNSRQDELIAVKGELQTEASQHNVTEERLDTCSTTLAETQSKLETARTFVNISRWDVLFTPPYLNKVLTQELFQQLTSSWDPLSELVLSVLYLEYFICFGKASSSFQHNSLGKI